MKPRVACISFSDGPGGAGKAAYKIHRTFLNYNIDSKMIVAEKSSDCEKVFMLPFTFRAKLARYVDFIFSKLAKKKNYKTFSNDFLSQVDYNFINKEFDIVMLFWVGGGFVNSKCISKIKIPVIWRLSDTMALTGGCHYPGLCTKFTVDCNNCPQLGNSSFFPLAKLNFSRKKRNYRKSNLIFACPSKWIQRLIDSSSATSFCKSFHVPTGIDETVFFPRSLNDKLYPFPFSQNYNVVLFGAAGAIEDPRKGFRYFFELIQKNSLEETKFVIFGNKVDFPELVAHPNVLMLGQIQDQNQLSLLYASSDVFVAPSIEDNLPNTILESMACGTPVCCFNIGGNSDVIDHKENGYLCESISAEELEKGINFILESNKNEIRQKCRKKIKQGFTLYSQNQNYKELIFNTLKNIT